MVVKKKKMEEINRTIRSLKQDIPKGEYLAVLENEDHVIVIFSTEKCVEDMIRTMVKDEDIKITADLLGNERAGIKISLVENKIRVIGGTILENIFTPKKLSDEDITNGAIEGGNEMTVEDLKFFLKNFVTYVVANIMTNIMVK